jgi:cytochrome P450
MAELDARRARWDAEDEARRLRAYVQAGIEARRPDPAGCIRTLLLRRRRWLEQEYGR